MSLEIISFIDVILKLLARNIFPQKKTLRDLKNKLRFNQMKGMWNGLIRIMVLAYLYSCMLYVYKHITYKIYKSFNDYYI